MNEIKAYTILVKIKTLILKVYNKFYNLYIFLRMINDKITSRIKRKPMVMTIEESINYICTNRCSVSRYGDGEMKLISGKSIDFQPYSREIENRLREVLSCNNMKHIIGIPDVFGSLDKYDEEAAKYWRKHLAFNRKVWYSLLSKDKVYINSFISRCYMIFKDKEISVEYFNSIKKLWDSKEIIIVEGEESRVGVGNDLFSNSNSINRILAPRKNAFSRYNKILTEIKKINNNKMILIALGPTASILAYDLSMLGYQAIDIGHIDIEYEWFLKKAKNKIKVANKYVGEAPNGTDVNKCLDKDYLNQIISIIT